jgi:hypothetical protein
MHVPVAMQRLRSSHGTSCPLMNGRREGDLLGDGLAVNIVKTAVPPEAMERD